MAHYVDYESIVDELDIIDNVISDILYALEYENLSVKEREEHNKNLKKFQEKRNLLNEKLKELKN